MDSIEERLNKLAAHAGVGLFKVSMEIGLSKTTLNMLKGSKNGIPSEYISRIAEKYPEVSIEYMVTGKGDLLKSDKRKKELLDIEKSLLTCIVDVRQTDYNLDRVMWDLLKSGPDKLMDEGQVRYGGGLEEEQAAMMTLRIQKARMLLVELKIKLDSMRKELLDERKQTDKKGLESTSGEGL